MDRKTTSLGLALILSAILSACATQSVPDIPFDSYSQTDVSIILAANFDSSQDEAYRALKPSFDKFGAPKRYVDGNMSAVHESRTDRLYGSGNLHAPSSPFKSIFWQIDGEDLGGDVSPIKTVHLIYDKKELGAAPYQTFESETRRGNSFTVFERDLGARVVVSIYPSERLPNQAELNVLEFQD